MNPIPPLTLPKVYCSCIIITHHVCLETTIHFCHNKIHKKVGEQTTSLLYCSFKIRYARKTSFEKFFCKARDAIFWCDFLHSFIVGDEGCFSHSKII